MIRLFLPVEPRKRLFLGLLVGLTSAALVGSAQFVVARIASGFFPNGVWLVPGVPGWPFAGALAGLIVVFGGSIRAGAAAGVAIAVLGGLGLAATVTLPPAVWLLFAIEAASAVGMRLGGGAYLRHWTLRWLLARDGMMPWNSVLFLDHSARLNLLRRRGGGYEFFHRLVQAHLCE